MPVMQDRRGEPPALQQTDAAELGLQRAIAISRGTCWTEDGRGGAIIHGGYKEIRLSSHERSMIKFSAGNDEAIAEILEDNQRPRPKTPVRKAVRRKHSNLHSGSDECLCVFLYDKSVNGANRPTRAIWKSATCVFSKAGRIPTPPSSTILFFDLELIDQIQGVGKDMAHDICIGRDGSIFLPSYHSGVVSKVGRRQGGWQHEQLAHKFPGASGLAMDSSGRLFVANSALGSIDVVY